MVGSRRITIAVSKKSFLRNFQPKKCCFRTDRNPSSLTDKSTQLVLLNDSLGILSCGRCTACRWRCGRYRGHRRSRWHRRSYPARRPSLEWLALGSAATGCALFWVKGKVAFIIKRYEKPFGASILLRGNRIEVILEHALHSVDQQMKFALPWAAITNCSQSSRCH